MKRSAPQLLDDARAIWRAGVDAVLPARLVPQFVQVVHGTLVVGDDDIPLAKIRRIVVVGGGKASGAMAEALEEAIGVDVLRSKCTASRINVPVGAGAATQLLHVCEVRPAGVNEPTEAAAAGVEEMLRLVRGLGPDDLCFCLVSGGGSALLPAPIEGFSLADKIALTRELSASGATIHEMNAVRTALSRVKGGGLVRACGGSRLVALILSDVPGDELAAIASGPTVVRGGDRRQAVEVLQRYGLDKTPPGRRAVERLHRDGGVAGTVRCRVDNLLIGNNATAVDGAGVEAERRGYSHAMISARAPEGDVADVARRLVDMAVRMRLRDGPDCLISGGEPTIRLAPPHIRGRGGRNQQLCLEAIGMLDDWRDVALVSGGTDGEDGPTDAAGGYLNAAVLDRAVQLGVDRATWGDHCARNDAYGLLQKCGGLLVTGPTHTNVGDLRVITVSR